MFGVGTTELLVFAVIVLLAVGPERMPTLMRAIGRGLRELRRASREFRDAVGLDELLRDDTLRRPVVRPPSQKPLSFEESKPQDASDASESPEAPAAPDATTPKTEPPPIPSASADVKETASE